MRRRLNKHYGSSLWGAVVVCGLALLVLGGGEAVGGVSAAVSNQLTSANTGDVILQGTANGSACTSSNNVIITNSQRCNASLLPNGQLPSVVTSVPSLVQTVGISNATGSAVSSLSLSLTAASTTGDLLAVAVGVQSSVGITMSDSAGNTWQVGMAPLYNAKTGSESAVYYAANANSVTQITATFSATAPYPSLVLYEVAAVSTTPLDVVGSNSSATPNPITVATSTATTAANDFAVVADGTAKADTLSATGWTVNNTYATSNLFNSAYQMVPSAQVANFTTTVRDKYEAVIATFAAQPPHSALSVTAIIKNGGNLSGATQTHGGICGVWGANDYSGNGNAGIVYNGVAGSAGPFTSSNAFAFSGNGVVNTTNTYNNPNNYSMVVWFKTTGTGTILGTTNAEGGSGQTSWDRQLWIDGAGNLVFGVYNPGASNPFEEIVSSNPYNNGQWHWAVATIGAAGQQLYVDGALVGSNAAIVSAQNYVAYWHIGWDSEAGGWPNAPASPYFTGAVMGAAMIPAQLSGSQVSGIYGGSTTLTAYHNAIKALTPQAFWELQDTGYIYPDAIPGAPTGAASACSYVGITLQATGNGVTSCLVPAGSGNCPALNGSSDATLNSLSSNLSLGNWLGGSSWSFTYTLAQEGTTPTYDAGLHPSLPITWTLTQQTWQASLRYGGSGVVFA